MKCKKNFCEKYLNGLHQWSVISFSMTINMSFWLYSEVESQEKEKLWKLKNFSIEPNRFFFIKRMLALAVVKFHLNKTSFSDAVRTDKLSPFTFSWNFSFNFLSYNSPKFFKWAHILCPNCISCIWHFLFGI